MYQPSSSFREACHYKVDVNVTDEDTCTERGCFRSYFGKYQGMETTPEACPAFQSIAILPINRGRSTPNKIVVLFWSFVSSFCGIAILAVMQYNMQLTLPSGKKINTLTGSFGAMAILVFGTIHAPLAQPRNVILGNTLSSFIGVTVAQIFLYLAPGDEWKWLSCSLAVSLSMFAMQLSDTVHPPGGASALIAVMSEFELNYFYVVMPVFTGSCILVGVAISFLNPFTIEIDQYHLEQYPTTISPILAV